jgi:hypothetical protein
MKSTIKWCTIALLVITSPIWLPILLVVNFFEKPAPLTPDEVEAWLQRMHNGEFDKYWWDDFLNVPIENPELDDIRKRCDYLWSMDSEYLERVDENTFRLNEQGLSEVGRLIKKYRRIQCQNPASQA